MAEAKFFNNNIIGQYVLTRVPVKVYVDGRFLTITDVDDIEDPLMGFGMDENGAMKHFAYSSIEHLLIHGNKVDIETYNKGMAAAFGGGEEKGTEKKADDKEEGSEEKGGIFGKKKEESFSKLGDLISEASQEEVDAEVEGAEAQIDAAKAKTKAAKAAEKETIKKAKEKIKAAQAQPIDDGVIKEDREDDVMLHDILSVAGKVDGYELKKIASAFGIFTLSYDPEDVGDMDDLYNDLEKEAGNARPSVLKTVYNKLRKMNLVEGHQGYTFGTGDIVKNKNPKCKHFGSMGIVDKIMDLPNMVGKVAVYTVTNNGDTYKTGDKLTKTVDQLEKI